MVIHRPAPPRGESAPRTHSHRKARRGDAGAAELQAAVRSRAVAGALVAALDVWTRRAGGEPDELRELTQQALELLRTPPNV